VRRRNARRFRADSTTFLLATEQGESSHGNWAISYGDMVTLLLSFFVLFFGVRESSKIQKFQKTITQKSGAVGMGSNPAATASVSTGTGTGAGAGTATKVDQAWKKLKNLEGARFVKDQQRLVIEFPDVAFFQFNRTELTKEGKKELSNFAELFNPYQQDLRLIVIGYTDNVPVKLSKKKNKVYRYTDNWELSALRGVSAVRELVLLGLSSERVRVGGEGEWKGQSSYASGSAADTGVGDWKSRRVVLVIESEEKAKR